MSIVTTAMLTTILSAKKDWSGYSDVAISEQLAALELADPSTPVELPIGYQLSDVVAALTSLGLVVEASSGS